MPLVTLDVSAERKDAAGECMVIVTLHNPSTNVGLMTHVQLRRSSGERVLPAYYSGNYVSLLANETKVICIEAAGDALGASAPIIALDGWNVAASASAAVPGVQIITNVEALPSHSPVTGLPFQSEGLR